MSRAIRCFVLLCTALSSALSFSQASRPVQRDRVTAGHARASTKYLINNFPWTTNGA